MLQLYIGLGVAAVIAALGLWLKSAVDDAAEAKATTAVVQDMLDQAEENTKFEHKRADAAEAHVAKLDAENATKDKSAETWRRLYGDLVKNNPQVGAWAKLPVPDPVIDNVLVRDAERRGAAPIHSAALAGAPLPGVPPAANAGAPGNADRGVDPGAGLGAGRAGAVQPPTVGR